MFGLAPEDKIYFYIVPLLVFGPVFLAVLWNFGLKNIFHTPPELKERMRLEREHSERIVTRRESKAGFHARTVHAATQPSLYWLAQGGLYALFALVLGAFSAWPTYQFASPDMAQIKLSLSHPGQRVEECHKRTREELAALAPNMRAKMDCSRERNAVTVELELDDKLVFKGVGPPAGLRSDGSSSFYEKFRVPAGHYTLTVRLNDAGGDGFTHSLSQEAMLAPSQNLVIGFREDGSGLYIK